MAYPTDHIPRPGKDPVNRGEFPSCGGRHCLPAARKPSTATNPPAARRRRVPGPNGIRADERRIADLRNWVTGWYDNLALRLVADLTDDEVPDDL
jgi:hypothetical protein